MTDRPTLFLANMGQPLAAVEVRMTPWSPTATIVLPAYVTPTSSLTVKCVCVSFYVRNTIQRIGTRVWRSSKASNRPFSKSSWNAPTTRNQHIQHDRERRQQRDGHEHVNRGSEQPAAFAMPT